MEESKFCSQCGAKLNSGVKFCSNCGHDLKNSSSEITSDKTIKVEVINATIEKGVETVGKGVKAAGENLRSSMGYLKKTIKIFVRGIVKILILGAILYGVAFIGFMLQESYLKNDRDKALQDLKLKIETAQAEPFVESEWKVSASADPASGKKLVTGVSTFSNGYLCSMSVERRIDRNRLTSFNCSFEFHRIPFFSKPISIKFDNNRYEMQQRGFSGAGHFMESSFYVSPDEGGELAHNSLSYYNFINHLTSAKTVAIQVAPTVDHEYYEFYNYATDTPNNSSRSTLGNVWIRFPLKGAKEAIAKLGSEHLP